MRGCDAIFYLDISCSILLHIPAAAAAPLWQPITTTRPTTLAPSYPLPSAFRLPSGCLPSSSSDSIFLPLSIHPFLSISLYSSPTSTAQAAAATAALIMARLPVQLSTSVSLSISMQLTISIMMLLSYSSIFLHLPLSDAARVDTFTKGVDPALKENAAPTPRMRWITAGASADAFDGLVWLQRERPMVAKSFRESWSAPRAADEEQLQKVALLSLANVPALGMWQITDDEEVVFRTMALVLAGSDPAAKTLADDIFPRLQQDNFPRRKALQADISPPGMWQGNDDQSQVKSGKRSLLADISPPGIWTDAEVIDSRFQKRSLLADISPPGMWSDDADDTQDKYHKRRLLADISPPGMWPGSDDQSSDIAQK